MTHYGWRRPTRHPLPAILARLRFVVGFSLPSPAGEDHLPDWNSGLAILAVGGGGGLLSGTTTATAIHERRLPRPGVSGNRDGVVPLRAVDLNQVDVAARRPAGSECSQGPSVIARICEVSAAGDYAACGVERRQSARPARSGTAVRGRAGPGRCPAHGP